MNTPQTGGPARYTSIPITIEALQWDGEDSTADAVARWTEDTGAVVDTDHIQHLWDYDHGCYVMPSGKRIFAPYNTHCLIILTLEGEMVAEPGWWIIRGTEGEFYPCKDSIFRAKYRPATPEVPRGDSSVRLYRHEYAENSFILSAFTGQLLLSRQDLEEAYRQLDDFLYPNPGYEPRIAEVPR